MGVERVEGRVDRGGSGNGKAMGRQLEGNVKYQVFAICLE